MKNKKPVSEAKACGYMFALSNLGLIGYRVNKKGVPQPYHSRLPNHDTIILSEAVEEKDWDTIESKLHSILGSFAESDEMFDGFLEEVKYWLDDYLKGNEYVLKEWEVFKEHLINKNITF